MDFQAHYGAHDSQRARPVPPVGVDVAGFAEQGRGARGCGRWEEEAGELGIGNVAEHPDSAVSREWEVAGEDVGVLVLAESVVVVECLFGAGVGVSSASEAGEAAGAAARACAGAGAASAIPRNFRLPREDLEHERLVLCATPSFCGDRTRSG